MARGEGSKADLRGPGIAIGVTFTVLCLGALTCVVSTTRSCTSCTPAAIFAPPAPSEPFAGAALAASELGWRDAARARQAFGSALAPDPAAAASATEPLLSERGYVEHAPAGSAREMPFDATLGELEGACGVALIAGEGSARIGMVSASGGVASAGDVVPVDPSLAVVGACGAVALRVSGVGRATLRVLAMPGVTPGDVARGGLPADVVLAHAEAEVLLRRRGLEPADWVQRDPQTSRGGATGAAFYPTLPATPPSGCIVWVGVALGAGRAESSWSYSMLSQDQAPDRALFLTASCASSGARVTLYDDSTPGATVFWRAYGGAAGGPVTPDPGVAIMPSAGTLHEGSTSDPLPDAIPGT